MSGELWALTAGLGFGLFQTLNRRAVDGMNLYMATFIQLLVSTIVLTIVSLMTVNVRMLFSAPLLAIVYFGLAGISHFVIGWTFMNASQKRIGAARTSPIIGTSPLFATILAAIFIREFPSILAIVGVLLIVCGTFVISSGGANPFQLMKTGSTDRVAWSDSLFGLSAAFFWALSPIFIRAGLKDLPSPLLGVTVGSAVSMAGYGVALMFQRKRWLTEPYSKEALGFKIVAGILVGLSTWARWVALDLAPVAVVLAITMISVPMVIWLSPILSGKAKEPVSSSLWLGAALIIAGALILTFIP